MKRIEYLILGFLILILLSLGVWLIFNEFTIRRSSYIAGTPPENVRFMMLPQTIELAKMKPPAVRFTDPMRYGNNLSEATVVFFGDFNSPDSRATADILSKIISAYNGRVRLVWRDHPSLDDDKAMTAAIYTRCTAFQGKFWETYDILNTVTNPNETVYSGITRELKLNSQEIAACRKDQGIRQLIETDVKAAQNDGVNSVPFLFIGTEAHQGLIDESTLKEKIDTFLNS
ncbi:MAG: thioredoxin domain-containing protein [Patescibacteria group bacterium]